ncbi:MAG: ATP-binding cassette domain-containing protein [Opitutales bacterium]
MSDTHYSIEARGLTKFYGATAAIKNVSFTVSPGEIVGFLGPNGAGKSTTLRILSGLLRADRGEAFVAGTSVARCPNRVKKSLGYMPENNPLPEDLRVIEYLRHRARLKGLSARRARARIDTVLEACDLQRTARRKLIGALSKGYRQRVGLADAILAEPEVTILDEPTIGLDPHQVVQIRKLIDALRGRTTVILSSHILAEVEISCDRVIILNQGVIVASGPPAALRQEFFPGSHYEVEVAGSGGLLEAAAGTLGRECSLEQFPDEETGPEGFRRVRLHYPGDDEVSESLLAALTAQRDLRVRSFRRSHPTLEDIFLAATRRSWEIETELATRAAGSPQPTSPR